MRRRIYIAQLLIAQSEFSSVTHTGEHKDEDGNFKGYLYSAKPKGGGEKKTILATPGGTIKVKKGDEFETIDAHVPYDITELHDSSKEDFHKGIIGWLRDSDAVKEDIH